jgi:adhesin/invasin
MFGIRQIAYRKISLNNIRKSSRIKLTGMLLLGGLFLGLTFGLATAVRAQTTSFLVFNFAPAEVTAGTPLTYTLRVFNSSTLRIDVEIFEPLPAGATVVSPGGAVQNGNQLEWRNIQIDPATPIERQYVLMLNQAGTVVNNDYYAVSGSVTEYGAPVTTLIKPGPAKTITLAANPTSVSVGGSSQLTVSIVDNYGNMVADNTPVSLGFNLGTIDGVRPPASGVTTAGQWVKTWQAGTLAATGHITATSGTIQKTLEVPVAAGPPSQLTVSAAPATIAAGSQSSTITAVVKDQYDNPVNNAAVTFATDLGTLNNNGSSVVVNTSNDQASASLRGTQTGQATLTISVAALTPKTQQVTIAAGPLAALDLAANPTAIVANGTSTSDVTLHLKDAYGNLLDRATPITLTTTLGTWPGAGMSYTASPTAGLVQVPLKAITRTGVANLRATAGSLTTDNFVSFIPGPPTRVDLSINPTTLVADGQSTAVLRATVWDAFNNRVSDGTTVSFAAPQGTWVGGSTKTTINGVADKTLQSNTYLGRVPITVTAGSVVSTGSIDFTAGPPDTVDVSLNPTSPITAGVPVSVTFTVRDRVGHALPGVPLTVSTTRGNFTPANSGNSDAGGQLQLSLRSTQAGLATLGVTGPGGPLTVNNQLVTFVPDVPVQASLSVTPSSLVANGVSSALVSATVSDQYGNPVSGFLPSFTLSPASLGTLSGSTATNGSGQASRSLKSTTNLGQATLSISNLPTVTPATVDFVTGPPASAALTAVPTTTLVGQNVTLNLIVKDSVNRLLIGKTLVVTSTFGTVSGCTVTDSQGKTTCTLNSTKSGQPKIYVEGILASGDAITYQPGTLNGIAVTPYGTSGAPIGVSAGVPFDFNAQGRDVYNNPITTSLNFTWTVLPYGGNGSINPITGEFTGSTAGLVRIEASAGSKTGGSYARVGAGAASRATVQANPTTLPANGVNASTLTFTVLDGYGNPVGGGVALNVTSSRGDLVGNSLTDANSRAYRTLTSRQAGQAVINVTNLANLTGQTVVTFTAGVPAKARVSATPASLPANGVAQATLRITLLDSFDNPVGAGYTPYGVTSLGTLSGSGSTNTQGEIFRTLTAPTQAGTATITARYLGVPLAMLNNEIPIVVGPLDRVAITPAGPLSVPAGQPVTLYAQGYDADNAPLPNGLNYSWRFQSDPTGGASLNPIFNQNTTFIGTQIGSGIQVVGEAEEGGNLIRTTLHVTVIPGPPAAGALSLNPASAIANGTSPITVSLTGLVDQFGNPANGDVVTVTLHSQPLSRAVQGTVSAGQAHVVLTATTKAGTYPITAASLWGELSLTGPTTVSFVPGPLAKAELLSATPAQVVANGSSTSQLVLQLRDTFDNALPAGLTPIVTSTLGSILPGGAASDASGQLYRTLQAGLALGNARLWVNGLLASGPAVPFIPGPPVSASLTIQSPTLTAGGASTPVVFSVTDAWGHPVADGTVITPTLTPALGSFSGSRLTKNGLMTQTLTAGPTVGTATVGAPGLAMSGGTAITIVPAPAAKARLTASPASLTVGGTSTLALTITDAYGNLVPPTVITLTASLGAFEGNGAAISKTTALSTAQFSTTLASTRAGTETVALSGPTGPLSLTPDSSTLVFRPGPPVDVTLEPTGPVTVAAGSPLTVTVSSRDSYGNAVDPWSPVSYTWSQNATNSNQPGYGAMTSLDPRGRVIKFDPRKAGANQLWASGGVKPSPKLALNIIAGAPANAAATVKPASIPADGLSTLAITLTNVTDLFGNPIPDGRSLTVTVQSAPTVSGSGLLAGGRLILTLPSSTQAGTHPMAVTGSGGPVTLSGNTTVTFTPGEPVRAAITASPKQVPGDGVSTANLTVKVYDSYANLVADGMPITVTTSLGTLSGGGATSAGQVARTVRAPVGLGTATFSVTAPNGPLFVGGDTVQFIPGAPVYAALTANPAKVLADGLSTSALMITIKDALGFTVNTSQATSLSVTRGAITPTLTFASSGVAHAIFTAGASPGDAGLAVVYNGVPLAVVGDKLTLIPGPAFSGTLTANPKTLKAGSNERSTLRLKLSDAWGHPVADGTVVTITTSLGELLPATNTTVGGWVTRTLTPGVTLGTASFTVDVQPRDSQLRVSGETVTITAGDLVDIDILPAGPVQVPAGSKLQLQAIGRDALGHEVGTGLFAWELLLDTSGGRGELSSNGVFTGTKAGTVGIKASQGVVWAEKELVIIPGPVVTAVVSAKPITVAVGGDTSELTITARDAFGNLAADGAGLNVTSNLGTILGSGVTKNGVLTRTLKSGSYFGQVDLFINGWPAAGDKPLFMPRAQVTANPSRLPADGKSKSILTIQAFDKNGQLLPDGSRPGVSASSGKVENCGATVSGLFTCHLVAPTTQGTAKIFVSGLQAGGSQVEFFIGPAAIAVIEAQSISLLADGSSTTQLTIKVQDAYGHLITNAGPLTVRTNLGAIIDNLPTMGGVTNRTLRANPSPGTAHLSVEGLTVTGDYKIHFVGETFLGGNFDAGLEHWTLGQITDPLGQGRPYSATVLASDRVDGIIITPPSSSEVALAAAELSTSTSGGQMVRLGATTADNTGHDISEVWLSQPIQVKSDGVTQVQFNYRLLSYDVAVGSAAHRYQEWDPFEVYLNGQEVLRDGFTWSPAWEAWYKSAPSSPGDLGWKQGVLDLTPYAGQVVTLEFRVPNRQAAIDNTWVYLDDISLAYREESKPAFKQVFLPLIGR